MVPFLLPCEPKIGDKPEQSLMMMRSSLVIALSLQFKLEVSQDLHAGTSAQAHFEFNRPLFC